MTENTNTADEILIAGPADEPSPQPTCPNGCGNHTSAGEVCAPYLTD